MVEGNAVDVTRYHNQSRDREGGPPRATAPSRSRLCFWTSYRFLTVAAVLLHQAKSPPGHFDPSRLTVCHFKRLNIHASPSTCTNSQPFAPMAFNKFANVALRPPAPWSLIAAAMVRTRGVLTPPGSHVTPSRSTISRAYSQPLADWTFRCADSTGGVVDHNKTTATTAMVVANKTIDRFMISPLFAPKLNG